MKDGIPFSTEKGFVSLITGKQPLKWKDYADSLNHSKRDHIQLRKNRALNEACYVASTSRMPIYKNGRLCWSGKNHKREYGHQYCMWCDHEINNFSWKDGKPYGVRIFIESFGYANSYHVMYFLCSKKCYDAIRAYKKRNPTKPPQFAS